MAKICVYSNHAYEKPFLLAENKERFQLVLVEESLSAATVQLANGCSGVALFTSDDASPGVLKSLKKLGVNFVVTRSTGHDHIDLAAAAELGMRVAYVPAYSPNAVAEHAVAMMLALSRQLVLANQQVRQYNFTLDKLVGFNLYEKVAGVVGTGAIGNAVVKILHGFGCRIIACDVKQDKNLIDNFGVTYTTLEELCKASDIITMHIPLTDNTTYLINKKNIGLMKKGVMLINTSRGKIMKTSDVLDALQTNRIGYLGMDVYENEKGVFFKDLSVAEPKDPILRQLLSLPNVLITPHQAFLTNEALKNIAEATMFNIGCFVDGKPNPNELTITS